MQEAHLIADLRGKNGAPMHFPLFPSYSPSSLVLNRYYVRRYSYFY